MTRTAVLISSLLFLATVLIGCGGNNESPPANTSPNGQSSMRGMPASPSAPNTPGGQADSQIVISNMAYAVPASVRPGQQVNIINQDDPNHSVTADANNLFDVRVSGGGGIKSFTAPMSPGAYPFHCKYHTNMHGTLTVQ